MRAPIFVFASLIAVLLIGLEDHLRAAEGVQGGINYAYSTWVGTGYYSVGDRRVYILRGRLSYPVTGFPF